MKTLVINSDDQEGLELLEHLAQKLGLQAHLLTEDQQEDAGLLQAMLEGRKGDYVEEEEVMKALRK